MEKRRCMIMRRALFSLVGAASILLGGWSTGRCIPTSEQSLSFKTFQESRKKVDENITLIISWIDEERRLYGINIDWAFQTVAGLGTVNDYIHKAFATATAIATIFTQDQVTATTTFFEESLINLMGQQKVPQDVRDQILEIFKSTIGTLKEGSTAVLDETIEDKFREFEGRFSPALLGEDIVKNILVPNILNYIAAFKGALLYQHAGLLGSIKAVNLSVARDLSQAGFSSIGVAATPILISFYLTDALGIGTTAQFLLMGRAKLEEASRLVKQLQMVTQGNYKYEHIVELYNISLLVRDACDLFKMGYEAAGQNPVVPSIDLGLFKIPELGTGQNL